MDPVQPTSNVVQTVVPQKQKSKLTLIIFILLGLVAIFIIAEVIYYFYNQKTYSFTKQEIENSIEYQSREVGIKSDFDPIKWDLVTQNVDIQQTSRPIFKEFQIRYSFQGRVLLVEPTNRKLNSLDYVYKIAISNDTNGEQFTEYFTQQELDNMEIKQLSETPNINIKSISDIQPDDIINITADINMMSNLPVKYIITVSR